VNGDTVRPLLHVIILQEEGAAPEVQFSEPVGEKLSQREAELGVEPFA
jgi:hypothetical protein